MTPSLRPELLGEFGMVASTHWLASGAGMSVLERGGNAFDAAVAAGLTLQVVQPHLNGPAGELSALLWSRDRGEPLVVCGQGVAPRRATIPEYRRRGLELVPGVGVLAACVPGAFDAWMLLLREFGTWRLQEVVQYAIGYAEHGYRASARLAAAIRESGPLLRTWPASAGVYLPAPEPGATVRNRVLAATYREIIRQSRGGSREREIECAREIFYRGFVAEAIHGFSEQHDGLLTGDDLAGWHASTEAPVTLDFQSNTVCKVGPWSQGPVFLQQLALLDGFDLRAMGLNSVEYAHTVLECAKLAFADREAFYGDPVFTEVPVARLLSEEYNSRRRQLIGDVASTELQPGGGRLPAIAHADGELPGTGEPTRGDTVHLDVVDRLGNMVTVTPSGGWLQSSPTIEALGFPLGTRGQMFWLDDEHPAGLCPGKRPRTTLSPSLVIRHGEPYLAFGTPGGDQQDQWTLGFFLAHTIFGLGLQAAIDGPGFHTEHFPSSFYPRATQLNVAEAEPSLGDDVITGLRQRGHDVRVVEPWSLGRVTCVARHPDDGLAAAASSRGGEAYATGR